MAPKIASAAQKSLNTARVKVGQFQFGTPEWEAAMVEVRRLVGIVNAERLPEAFCSVDSGVHPTDVIVGHRLIRIAA